MRKWLLAALLVMTALSGCMSDDEGTGGGDEAMADSDGDGFTDAEEELHGSDPEDPEDAPKTPDSLQFEGMLQGVGDSAATGSSTGCAAQESGQDPGCEQHSIDVPAPGWKVTFTLTPGEGTVTTSPDYDLFILDADGEQIGESTEPGGQTDEVTATLSAGTYTAQVQAWDNQDAPYTLDITFAF